MARWARFLLLASPGLAACTFESSETLASSQLSILGGEPAATCEWPSVVAVLPSRCSGVLVERRVVVTATHCLYDLDGRLQAPTAVVFGERLTEPSAERAVDTCFVQESTSGDVAFCRLAEPAPEVPIIPLMAACEDAWLNSGQPAIEVGFGDRNVDPPRETGVKTALSVVVVRARANEPYLEVSAGNQAGEYYGDSGGPLFVAAPDGTWRVAGIDSGSPAFVPGSTAPRFSYYASVPAVIDWAEAATGIDLTPCHELGRWQPSAACEALPPEETSAAEPDGWASACQRRPFSVPSPTCEGQARASLRASGGCVATRAPSSLGSSVWMGFVLLLLCCARRSR